MSDIVNAALRIAHSRRRGFADGGAAFGTTMPQEDAERAPSFLDNFVRNTIGSLATLPKRAIEGAAQYQPGSGEIPDATIGPALESAMLPMGTGAMAGVPVRSGEAILGAGPVRGIKAGMDAPQELYHVVGPEYEAGSPLRSLYARKGNDAYDEYAARWPNAGDLVQYHPHQNFFYDKLSDAENHAADFGGKILKIDPKKVGGLNFDKNEGFWTTREDVSPEAFIDPFGKTNSATAGIGPAAKSIRAYHGSPHDFDRFDLSKIGTGEGAQAYGHGLYFAENEGVAKAYRDALAGSALNTDRNAQLSALAREMRQYEVPGQWGKYNDPRGYELKRQYNAILDERAADKGKMYEVNINADPEHFLDWDKPLSEQPEHVQQAFKRAMPDTPVTQAWKTNGVLDNANLAGLYKGIAGQTNADVAAGKVAKFSSDLNQAGIPGIKYLDQGSRPPRSLASTRDSIDYYSGVLAKNPNDKFAADQLKQYQDDLAKYETGSRNYVVFDDKLVDILRKYGLAGIPATGAIAGAANSMPQDNQHFASGGSVNDNVLPAAYNLATSILKGDTGSNAPERPETLQAQQGQLVSGLRAAQMFPRGTPELPVPQGMGRAETPRGAFHYDPARVDPMTIARLSNSNRENELLSLGPFNKEDIARRIAAGEPPVAVIERAPDGSEIKSAVGTPSTAKLQHAAFELTKSPGSTIGVEPLADVVNRRRGGGVPAFGSNGRAHVGPIKSQVAGRTDKIDIVVPPDCYVVPADVVSALGQGNTEAGFAILSKDYPHSASGDGGSRGVKAKMAGGEYVISPQDCLQKGRGNMERGHKAIRQEILDKRKQTVKTLSKLPGPVKD